MNPPDRRIGRYTIDQVIGTGAFATVYRATDERLDGTVVLKLLADNHCLDLDIRARFVNEGRALRRIDSPHVVRVYDAGETDRMQPYLVLEHADRGSLAGRVAGLRAEGWCPDVVAVAALVAGLASAVEAVHAAGLVHRDLSPRNILLRSVPPGSVRPGTAASDGSLVRSDERMVLADLGLSKDLARSSGLTVAGGTDGFRPPEQRGAPARVDSRADLWGLSAVVFWLLTGAAPGDEAVVVDRGRLDGVVAELGLPVALVPVLLRGLADDPQDRHPDAATWREEMEAALAPPPPAVIPPPPPSVSSAAASRRRLLSAVLLVVAGVVLGAGTAAVVTAGGGDDADAWTTTRLDDGQLRLEATDPAGEAQLALVGEGEATVGETVSFSADAQHVDQWVWLMPDGTVYTDRPTVQLRSTSAGRAPVTLLGTADSGERLEVVHELHVVEE